MSSSARTVEMVQEKPIFSIDQRGNVRRRFKSVAAVMRAEGLTINSRGGLMKAVQKRRPWHGQRWRWGTVRELEDAAASDDQAGSTMQGGVDQAGSAMHGGGGAAGRPGPALTAAVNKAQMVVADLNQCNQMVQMALADLNQSLAMVSSMAIVISQSEQGEGISSRTRGGRYGSTRFTD
eukprot:SAG31_NODE_9178_length_1320_cov_2.370188_2_plen_179_part_00